LFTVFVFVQSLLTPLYRWGLVLSTCHLLPDTVILKY
jgi:hypothetical protein